VGVICDQFTRRRRHLVSGETVSDVAVTDPKYLGDLFDGPALFDIQMVYLMVYLDVHGAYRGVPEGLDGFVKHLVRLSCGFRDA